MTKNNTKKLTSKQLNPPNPTGKGGFSDNPQNRSDGRWSKEHSQSYLLNKFLRMPVNEFKTWERTHPEDKRTVAESLAYARAVKARDDLANYKEVVDRTEGKAPYSIDLTTGGERITQDVMIELYNLTDEQLDKLIDSKIAKGGIGEATARKGKKTESRSS